MNKNEVETTVFQIYFMTFIMVGILIEMIEENLQSYYIKHFRRYLFLLCIVWYLQL